MAAKTVVVKIQEMPTDMLEFVIHKALWGIDKFNSEKEFASYMRLELDETYQPTWHCIVGKNYGSDIVHQTKNFIYFYLGPLAILLFKSG